MRVAVVNETSAVDKHPHIMAALDGRGLEVVNAGMAERVRSRSSSTSTPG